MGKKIRRLQVVVENSNETFTSAYKAPCFPKCWSVSGCVSLRLKSPNRESFWNACGTIRMVNLKGDHKCIWWRLTTPYQRTKWKKKKRKEDSECVCADGWFLQGPPTFIRNSCAPWLWGPTPGYSVATCTRFPSGGGVHDGKFGQKIFFITLQHLLSPRTSRQGPGFHFRAGRIKTWGHPGWPPGPGCQSQPPHLCSLSHQAAGPMAVNQVTTSRQ